MKLSKIIYSIMLLMTLSVTSFSQTAPPAPSPGIWAIIDTNYVVGTSNIGFTKSKITLQNTTISKITGTQFRVFYDKNAFSSATPSLIGSPANLYLQFVDNNANGYVTITMVYTGSSALYTIPNGETFEITFNHIVPFTSFQSLPSITNLSWTGLVPFSQVAAEQPGNDISLSLHNYGGIFKRPTIKFHGTFTNVNATPSKSLTVSLEKKPKVGGSWSVVNNYLTDSVGKFSITQLLDTTYYNTRLLVRGDTMGVGNVISVADAQRINLWVTGSLTPQSFDFYSADVNNDNNITISDAYGVFGRISGRFSVWPSSLSDIKFFTATEYTTIVSSPTVNMTGTISGVTNFTYNILPGMPDSVNFYVLVPGDANNTGYHMARLTPISIINPANAPQYIIDETVEYDVNLPYIEINLPDRLVVNDGNSVEIPVKVITGGRKLGALQLAFKYDSELLQFSELYNSSKSMTWMSFINVKDSIIEWGGYDPRGTNLLNDNEMAFRLYFIAKTPQNDWATSPLYTSRKFVGDDNANDMNVSASNGIVSIRRMSPGIVLKDNEILVFPNPTTGEVIIQFNVKEDSDVNLSFVDIQGKDMITVINKYLPAGNYSYNANISDLAPGIYYTTLKTLNRISTNKTILVK